MKKQYIYPEVERFELILSDAILSSRQYENQQIDIGGFDPDDDDLEPGGFAP